MFKLMATAILLASVALAPAGAYAQGNVLAAYVQTPPVGGNVDTHGCYPSAGYTWSVLKKSCIRIWEAGVRLDPVKPQGSAVMSAFVVFASRYDQRRAELYMVDVKRGLLLTKVRGRRTWAAEGYTLTFDNGLYSLVDSHGDLIYQEPE